MELINNKVVLKSSEDAIQSYDEGTLSLDLYVPPYGKNQLNEVVDTYYKEKFTVPYHYNSKGAETLIILKGRIQLTIYGKKSKCEVGDIINIPSHCPYGLTTLEDNCVIRGIYTDINMFSRYSDKKLISNNALNYNYNKDFIESEYNPEHDYYVLTEPVDTEEVEKNTLPQITSKADFIYEYNGWEGIKCNLKVGRWNLKNHKEIWEFTIEKGYQMQYFKPNPNKGLYIVNSGRVKIETGGNVFFAEKNDIIKIPQYTPYTITAMTDDTVVLDINVSTRLFRMLEMLELAQRDEPDKIKYDDWQNWLLKLNDSYLTGFCKS